MKKRRVKKEKHKTFNQTDCTLLIIQHATFIKQVLYLSEFVNFVHCFILYEFVETITMFQPSFFSSVGFIFILLTPFFITVFTCFNSGSGGGEFTKLLSRQQNQHMSRTKPFEKTSSEGYLNGSNVHKIDFQTRPDAFQTVSLKKSQCSKSVINLIPLLFVFFFFNSKINAIKKCENEP